MQQTLATALVVAVVLLTSLAGVADVAAGAPAPDSDFDGGIEVPADDRWRAQTAGGGDLDSGTAYWSGARLRLDASRVLPEDADEAERTFELWRVTDDGRLNQRIRSFAVGEDGTHELRTDGLAGRVAIRYDGRVVYVHEGVGYLESPPDGSEVTPGSAAVEFRRQTLDFSWSDPEVFPGQRTTLTVASNRDDFEVAVSGSGLSYEDLTALFPESAFAADHGARADEDVLLLAGGASFSMRLDTSVLEPGQGTLRFDVVDTDASPSARLTVNEPDGAGRIESLERRENVGDVLEADLSCTRCFLVVGSPDQDVLDVVELEDADGDDRVELRINLRYAGMDRSANGYPSGVRAYTSPQDRVTRYSSGAALEQVREELNYNVRTLSELRKQQGLRSGGRNRPLPPGELDLTVTTTDFLIDRSAYGDRAPYGSQLVIRDETDVKTVTLEPRSLAGVQVFAAPGESPPRQDADRLREVAAPREQVALGDDLVFRIDLSGAFGYHHAHGIDLDTLVRNREEGTNLRLEQLSGDATGEVSLRRTAVRFIADPEGDALYVVADTGRLGSDRLKPGEYRLTFALDGVAGRYDAYSTSEGYRGYPYLQPGTSESVSAVAAVATPTADIVEPEEASPHLEADGSLVVGGRTSVAPESPLRVTATATEYAWETSASAAVDETGRWTGTLALADAPGDEFTVSVTRDGERLAERTFAVRPPLDDGSGDGGSGDGGGGSDGGDGGDDGPLGDGDGDDGGVLGAIPGLGAITGLAATLGAGVGILVVVWAAWKLVIRRMLI